MANWKIPAHQSTNRGTSHAHQESGSDPCPSMGISRRGCTQGTSNGPANSRPEGYVRGVAVLESDFPNKFSAIHRFRGNEQSAGAVQDAFANQHIVRCALEHAPVVQPEASVLYGDGCAGRELLYDLPITRLCLGARDAEESQQEELMEPRPWHTAED